VETPKRMPRQTTGGEEMIVEKLTRVYIDGDNCDRLIGQDEDDLAEVILLLDNDQLEKIIKVLSSGEEYRDEY
jgi:hypothetical protein